MYTCYIVIISVQYYSTVFILMSSYVYNVLTGLLSVYILSPLLISLKQLIHYNNGLAD